MNREYRHGGAATQAIGFALKLTALACVSIAVCANEPTYNPRHLDAAPLARVDAICQKVMGLRPSAALFDNLWPGNPDQASSTNEYRGCVAGLSHSMESVMVARAESQADESCRAKGLKPGSPEAAVCALDDLEGGPASARIQLASLEVRPFIMQARGDAPVSVPESVRRTRLACAEIGLEPNAGAFASCVEGLTAAMSGRFMAEAFMN